MAKSRRTKALEIPPKVKKAVAERDSINGYPCCLWCGKPAPTSNIPACSCAHKLRRSRGGKGVETNIVTLCERCHKKFDGSDESRAIMDFIYQYMKLHYGNKWSIEAQKYKNGE